MGKAIILAFIHMQCVHAHPYILVCFPVREVFLFAHVIVLLTIFFRF